MVRKLFWKAFGAGTAGHVLSYRVTHGLVGHRVPGLPAMLLLDHVGAKSGKRRTTPLVYVPDGDDVVLVASRGGHPRNPASGPTTCGARPDTSIQVGSERRPVHARVATPEERRRLWPRVVRA